MGWNNLIQSQQLQIDNTTCHMLGTKTSQIQVNKKLKRIRSLLEKCVCVCVCVP